MIYVWVCNANKGTDCVRAMETTVIILRRVNLAMFLHSLHVPKHFICYHNWLKPKFVRPGTSIELLEGSAEVDASMLLCSSLWSFFNIEISVDTSEEEIFFGYAIFVTN